MFLFFTSIAVSFMAVCIASPTVRKETIECCQKTFGGARDAATKAKHQWDEKRAAKKAAKAAGVHATAPTEQPSTPVDVFLQLTQAARDGDNAVFLQIVQEHQDDPQVQEFATKLADDTLKTVIDPDQAPGGDEEHAEELSADEDKKSQQPDGGGGGTSSTVAAAAGSAAAS